MIIYKITNLINNKIYIGQSQNNNDRYYGSGELIIKAIKKYGKENFKKEILFESDSKDINLLNEKEIYWIEILNSRNPEIGYNIAKGGEGIDSETAKKRWENPEERLKISRIIKKLYEDPEVRRRNKMTQKIVWKNPELIEKKRIIALNQWKDPKSLEKLIESQKKVHSTEEYKKNVSNSHKKRWANPENVKKTSESQRKRFENPEERKKLSESHKGKIPWNKGLKKNKVMELLK